MKIETSTLLNIPAPSEVPARTRNIAALGCAGIAALLIAGCAGQEGPSGGQRDTSPPAVIATDPDTNAIRVSTQTIRLEFNKYVDRRTVEESVFISPFVGPLEYDWSGKEVEISFKQPLRRNTTYVVNLGTDVRDLNEGNKMAAGFTLAFSTGDSIDAGFITGRVFDEKPEGVMIFAYGLEGLNPDTLDPGRVKPDYIMQTGAGGLWTLAHIALGRYRVFAIRDEYHNLLYDKEVDAYGVLPGDISLTPEAPRRSDVSFRLTKEDTTKPFLTRVRALDRYRLTIRFSEAVDTTRFASATFSIEDTLSGRPVAIAAYYVPRATPAVATVVTADPLDSALTYRLRANGVFDPAGNPLDSLHASATFEGSNKPDTLRPSLSVTALRDSTRGYPVDQPLEIVFSQPVLHTPLAGWVVLRDTSRRVVNAAFQWENAAEALLSPRSLLRSKTWYQLRLPLDSARSYHGRRYRDSTFVLHFETLDMRTAGEISGMVVDREQTGARGPIYVTASSIDLRTQQQRTVSPDASGNFMLDRLIEGKYVISGYRDADSSGSFSYGKLFPYVPSERFTTYPDTVRVRARWAVGGVRLELK